MFNKSKFFEILIKSAKGADSDYTGKFYFEKSLSNEIIKEIDSCFGSLELKQEELEKKIIVLETENYVYRCIIEKSNFKGIVSKETNKTNKEVINKKKGK